MEQDDFTNLCAPRTVEEWRMEAHKWFDRLWRYSPDPQAARTRQYGKLACFLDMTSVEAHISNFDIPLCQKVIAFAKHNVRGGRKHGRKTNPAVGNPG